MRFPGGVSCDARTFRVCKYFCVTAQGKSILNSLDQLTPQLVVQRGLDADEQWLSTAVSRVRQSIETLFGWIEEKTGIEFAGKLRSYPGLLVHVFGRLAAAMFFWNKLRMSS